jgi:hypothetical protein
LTAEIIKVYEILNDLNPLPYFKYTRGYNYIN